MSNSRKLELRFWLKILGVFSALIILHGAMIPFVDGNFSLGIYKVSGPPRQNLIIGTSRIAQALQPSVLKNEFGVDFLNFAIDGVTTNYSQTYNRAIECKVDPGTKNGIFILSLDPWSFCRTYDPVSKGPIFTEKESAFGKLWSFNQPLNVEYLIRDCNVGWGSILMTSLRNNSTVNCHTDGWVEVTRPTDKESVEARKISKIEGKRSVMENISFSQERLDALNSLVEFLKSKGEVYFVRLPIDPDYLVLENEVLPNFMDIVNSLTTAYSVPFYDMQFLHKEVLFNDGHHINKDYAPFITKNIADWIETKRNVEAK